MFVICICVYCFFTYVHNLVHVCAYACGYMYGRFSVHMCARCSVYMCVRFSVDVYAFWCICVCFLVMYVCVLVYIVYAF